LPNCGFTFSLQPIYYELTVAVQSLGCNESNLIESNVIVANRPSLLHASAYKKTLYMPANAPRRLRPAWLRLLFQTYPKPNTRFGKKTVTALRQVRLIPEPVHTYQCTLSDRSGEVAPIAQQCIGLRYDTRGYFNVRSKADVSQFNLPHGTEN